MIIQHPLRKIVGLYQGVDWGSIHLLVSVTTDKTLIFFVMIQLKKLQVFSTAQVQTLFSFKAVAGCEILKLTALHETAIITSHSNTSREND